MAGPFRWQTALLTAVIAHIGATLPAVGIAVAVMGSPCYGTPSIPYLM